MPKNWTDFFTENNYQSVIIALPTKYQKFIDENFEQMVEQIYDIRILPDLDKYLKLSPGVELIDGKAVISIHESPMRGWGLVYKRLVDILASFIGILILSPILALVALLVKLSSKGPILYRQQRMGIDGSTFDCLKFRSMPITSENETGAVWTKKEIQGRLQWFLYKKVLHRRTPPTFQCFNGRYESCGPKTRETCICE